MDSELTPLEVFAEGKRNQAIMTGVLLATKDIMEVWNECNIQISEFSESNDTDEIAITKQAMIDSIVAEQAIIALAENLEEKFGISA